MHEFQSNYSPEEAYAKASALAATHHKDVNVMWRFARAAYNLAGACLSLIPCVKLT